MSTTPPHGPSLELGYHNDARFSERPPTSVVDIPGVTFPPKAPRTANHCSTADAILSFYEQSIHYANIASVALLCIQNIPSAPDDVKLRHAKLRETGDGNNKICKEGYAALDAKVSRFGQTVVQNIRPQVVADLKIRVEEMREAAQLWILKIQSGSFGDPDEKFEIKVTLQKLLEIVSMGEEGLHMAATVEGFRAGAERMAEKNRAYIPEPEVSTIEGLDGDNPQMEGATTGIDEGQGQEKQLDGTDTGLAPEHARDNDDDVIMSEDPQEPEEQDKPDITTTATTTTSANVSDATMQPAMKEPAEKAHDSANLMSDRIDNPENFLPHEYSAAAAPRQKDSPEGEEKEQQPDISSDELLAKQLQTEFYKTDTDFKGLPALEPAGNDTPMPTFRPTPPGIGRNSDEQKMEEQQRALAKLPDSVKPLMQYLQPTVNGQGGSGGFQIPEEDLGINLATSSTGNPAPPVKLEIHGTDHGVVLDGIEPSGGKHSEGTTGDIDGAPLPLAMDVEENNAMPDGGVMLGREPTDTTEQAEEILGEGFGPAGISITITQPEEHDDMQEDTKEGKIDTGTFVDEQKGSTNASEPPLIDQEIPFEMAEDTDNLTTASMPQEHVPEDEETALDNSDKVKDEEAGAHPNMQEKKHTPSPQIFKSQQQQQHDVEEEEQRQWEIVEKTDAMMEGHLGA